MCFVKLVFANQVVIKTFVEFVFVLGISTDALKDTFLGMKSFFANIFANKDNEFIFLLIYIFMFSQLICSYKSSIKSKVFFVGSSFSLIHVSSSSESSSLTFLDTKKESTLVFSVTAKSIGSPSLLRGSLMQKNPRDLVPLFLLSRHLQEMLLCKIWRLFFFFQTMWSSCKDRLPIEHREAWI